MAFQDGYLPNLMGPSHPALDDDRERRFAAADLELMKRIGQVIDVHYLGQPFFIKVSHEQGMVQIQIPILMGAENWYAVPIKYLATDPGLKTIIRGCGELLERYKIPRSAFSRDEYVAALDAMPIGRRQHGYLAT